MSIDFTPAASVKARQCAVLLAALRQGPVSTYTARDALGLASPAARVLDLKKRGHVIGTERCTVFDAAGRPHTCALYRLEGSDS